MMISIHAPRVGSDPIDVLSNIPPGNFNPRSPCGERPAHLNSARDQTIISIHAPRVGSDRMWKRQSSRKTTISIHAPRVGSDSRPVLKNTYLTDFNPRSPCGERPPGRTCVFLPDGFQSTLPVWGATYFFAIRNFIRKISIHAPRVGSDSGWLVKSRRTTKFQSTLPVWGATPI